MSASVRAARRLLALATPVARRGPPAARDPAVATPPPSAAPESPAASSSWRTAVLLGAGLGAGACFAGLAAAHALGVVDLAAAWRGASELAPAELAGGSAAALRAIVGGGALPSRPFVRVSDHFASAFDPATRNPRWVAERLTRANTHGDASRAAHSFREDAALPPALRSSRADYAGLGGRYDRGHLAPAADHRNGDGAMADTFLLSNVSPQCSALNREYWARLEALTRGLAARHAAVYVVSGPLFLPVWQPPPAAAGGGGSSAGDSGGRWRYRHEAIGGALHFISVPTHFFKAILVVDEADAPLGVAAFVLPNAPVAADAPLASFAVPLAALESAAGLELFRGLLPHPASWPENAASARIGGGADGEELEAGEAGGGAASPTAAAPPTSGGGGRRRRRRSSSGAGRAAGAEEPPLRELLQANAARVLAGGFPGALSPHAAGATPLLPPPPTPGQPRSDSDSSRRVLHLCALDAASACTLPHAHPAVASAAR